MIKEIELLAPGGDINSIKAAIVAGADAIYCGLNKFNARNRAENVTFENLHSILKLAHANNCQVFITLNIVVVDSEFPALVSLLNKLANTSVDAVIVQDWGLFHLLKTQFKSLLVHASTQATTHNAGQILFLRQLNVARVNLSRELSLIEIKELTQQAHKVEVLTEVFVHGSYCISFSGLCYMSSVHGGNSGNRGRCSQPCRDQYLISDEGKHFPLNLKDNSAFLNLNELAQAGVDSLKIEGRIKKFHYVYSIVNSWRRQLARLYQSETLRACNSELYQVFNRNFSNGFLNGKVGGNMYIDNPRDHSAIHLASKSGGLSDININKAKQEVFDQRTILINELRPKIEKLSIEKEPLVIKLSGKVGEFLKVNMKTNGKSWEFISALKLRNKGTEPLSSCVVLKRFKAFDETAYAIESINVVDLIGEVYLPFSELTALKNIILKVLLGVDELQKEVKFIAPTRPSVEKRKTRLSVALSLADDLHLCNNNDLDYYYKLPNNLSENYAYYLNLFKSRTQLMPWFPAILTGDNYEAAVQFMTELQPECIVSDNSGVAYEAYMHNITWLAGNELNIANSYSMLALKDNFNCAGALVSNEINKTQLKNIKKPTNFQLHYSVFHPITLMTSRQCLFQQVSGCAKKVMDDSCLASCEKSATLTNLKNETFFVNKQIGCLNKIFSEHHFLNTHIVDDMPNVFTSFFIDFSQVNNKTYVNENKQDIIDGFQALINFDANAATLLHEAISPTTCHQYFHRKGI